MLQDRRDIGSHRNAAIGPLAHPPHSKYERLIALAKQVPPATTVVVHPCDETSLRGASRGGGSRHHHSDSGRAGRQDHRRGQAARDRHQPLSRSSTCRTARRRRPKAVELIHESKGELLMKGSLHTDELMREVASGKTGPAHRAPHQPCLHHGRADPSGDAVHHRRCHQHLSRSRCQARHRAERDRSVHADRSGHAAGCHPFRGRDGDSENSVDHRRRGALQDGRSRPDHGRHPRRAARLRQRHRSRRRRRSRASSPRSRAARKSWSCPISRPATCWPRISHFLAKADAAGIVLGARVPIILTSRADSVRSRMASCAVAVLYAACAPARQPRCRRREPDGHHPRRQCRLFERQVPGVCGDAAGKLTRQIKGQMDGIGTRPRLRASGAGRQQH